MEDAIMRMHMGEGEQIAPPVQQPLGELQEVQRLVDVIRPTAYECLQLYRCEADESLRRIDPEKWWGSRFFAARGVTRDQLLADASLLTTVRVELQKSYKERDEQYKDLEEQYYERLQESKALGRGGMLARSTLRAILANEFPGEITQPFFPNAFTAIQQDDLIGEVSIPGPEHDPRPGKFWYWKQSVEPLSAEQRQHTYEKIANAEWAFLQGALSVDFVVG